VLFPAHFPGPGGAVTAPDDDGGFTVTGWVTVEQR
jgi:hypothetical protein